jgi:osmotically-inducible protein OsmY
MRFHPFRAAALIALAAAAGAARADIVTVDESPLARRSVGTLDGDSAFSYTADTTDRAVAERVMDALANEPSLEGAAITVLVDEGRVRLSGTARDEDQAAYAREVAQDAAGPAVAVSAESLQPGTGAY